MVSALHQFCNKLENTTQNEEPSNNTNFNANQVHVTPNLCQMLCSGVYETNHLWVMHVNQSYTQATSTFAVVDSGLAMNFILWITTPCILSKSLGAMRSAARKQASTLAQAFVPLISLTMRQANGN